MWRSVLASARHSASVRSPERKFISTMSPSSPSPGPGTGSERLSPSPPCPASPGRATVLHLTSHPSKGHQMQSHADHRLSTNTSWVNPISVNDCFPVIVQLIDPNGAITTSRHKLRPARKSVLLHNMA